MTLLVDDGVSITICDSVESEKKRKSKLWEIEQRRAMEEVDK